MELLNKATYIIKMILFIVHFFLLYSIIGTLWQISPLIYLFFVFHTIYVIQVILRIILKRDNYKNDLIYNCMQIGLYLYIAIIFYRINFTHIFYNKDTFNYFNVNFGIICFLMFFLIIYGYIELKERS